jgi:hypothetical protein
MREHRSSLPFFNSFARRDQEYLDGATMSKIGVQRGYGYINR